MNEDEIRERVTSSNTEVLRQSLSFVNEKLRLERSRSKKAEDRATVMLGAVGVLAGFAIQLSRLATPAIQGGWLSLPALYVGSICFLLKAGFFAIYALWSLRGYELTPELAFEVQDLTEAEAMREELVWKIWEYYQLLPVHNQRLFFSTRAQRNTFAAIASLALLALTRLLFDALSFRIAQCIGIGLAVIVAIGVFFLDPISERLGDLWQFE